MAVLDALPERQVIDGFKGIIDFYLWKGLPCARKWPVWHKRKPSAAELANQTLFAAIVLSWNDLDQVTRQTYRDLAQGTGLTGRDVYVRGCMKGLYRYPSNP